MFEINNIVLCVAGEAPRKDHAMIRQLEVLQVLSKSQL